MPRAAVHQPAIERRPPTIQSQSAALEAGSKCRRRVAALRQDGPARVACRCARRTRGSDRQPCGRPGIERCAQLHLHSHNSVCPLSAAVKIQRSKTRKALPASQPPPTASRVARSDERPETILCGGWRQKSLRLACKARAPGGLSSVHSAALHAGWRSWRLTCLASATCASGAGGAWIRHWALASQRAHSAAYAAAMKRAARQQRSPQGEKHRTAAAASAAARSLDVVTARQKTRCRAERRRTQRRRGCRVAHGAPGGSERVAGCRRAVQRPYGERCRPMARR